MCVKVHCLALASKTKQKKKKKKKHVKTPNQWNVVNAEILQTPVASDTVPDSASKQRFFISDWKEQFDWLENNEETKKKKNVLQKLPAEILFKERRIIYQIKDKEDSKRL